MGGFTQADLQRAGAATAGLGRRPRVIPGPGEGGPPAAPTPEQLRRKQVEDEATQRANLASVILQLVIQWEGQKSDSGRPDAPALKRLVNVAFDTADYFVEQATKPVKDFETSKH